MDEDPDEVEENVFLPNDFCFVFFEPAPADRGHYFVFREPDETSLVEEEDEETDD